VKFKIGDAVRLKPTTIQHEIEGVQTFPTAKIVSFLEDVEGGVTLDRRIGCVRYWNVEDLEPATEATRPVASSLRK
jgi:hypothetical protein